MLVKSPSSINSGATLGICDIGAVADLLLVIVAAAQKIVGRSIAVRQTQMAKLFNERIKISPLIDKQATTQRGYSFQPQERRS